MLLASAAVFGDLLEATFDVHRRLLYEALQWPQPRTPAEERASGRRKRELTEYLSFRGSDECVRASQARARSKEGQRWKATKRLVGS